METWQKEGWVNKESYDQYLKGMEKCCSEMDNMTPSQIEKAQFEAQQRYDSEVQDIGQGYIGVED